MKLKIVLVLMIALCAIEPSYSQKATKKIKITGAVVDANRKPVSDAIIIVDQVKTNVVTNEQGIYTVKVAPGAKTITAFSLLKGAKEMDIKGQSTVNFVLDGGNAAAPAPVQNQVDVVDVGYGSANKDEVLHQVIKTDASKNPQKTYTSIYDYILRELPGVQVNGTTIKLVQGPGSINAGTDPLFIVDGVVVSQVGNINPSDVESMEVLKGPAASIYGSRGANGVLLITTKK